MNDWFEWNGARSTDYGIHIIEPPTIFRAPERVSFTNVPGRPGSLTTLEDEDVYDDFILPLECTVADLSRLGEICAWLRGAGRLKLAVRPGGFYIARISNQIEFAKVLRNHENRTFTINFRCAPFWYAENVEKQTLTVSTSILENPGTVYSEPIITVYGSGEITLMVGLYIVELSEIEGRITLDCALQEAYDGDTAMNACMSGEFPRLVPGPNAISWSGEETKVEIAPNWRYL